MSNYWVEKVKRNRSGNWVIRVKNKRTGKQTQKSFNSDEFTKGRVKQLRQEIVYKDTHKNKDDYEYDPFNYISNEPNILFGKAKDLFIENCKQRELAANTVIFRKSVLKKFEDSYGKSRELKTMREKDVKNFINKCCNTLNSKNQYGSVFRQLSKFLEKNYDITLQFEVPNFGTKRQRKKEKSKNPTIIDENGLWDLYEYGLTRFPQGGNHRNYIDLQCLPIYFYTGLRKEELPHLKIRDLELKGKIPSAKVGRNKLTKNYKERTIWLPKKCHNQLKALMDGKSADDYLVDQNRSGSKNDIMRSASYVFNICYEEVFPNRDNMTLHKLRHSCGCWLLEEGFSMMFVKRQLGHARLDQTLTYARMTRRGFKKEVNKYKQEMTPNDQ